MSVQKSVLQSLLSQNSGLPDISLLFPSPPEPTSSSKKSQATTVDKPDKPKKLTRQEIAELVIQNPQFRLNYVILLNGVNESNGADDKSDIYFINPRRELKAITELYILQTFFVTPGLAVDILTAELCLKDLKSLMLLKGMVIKFDQISSLGYSDDPGLVWKRSNASRAELNKAPLPKSLIPNFNSFLSHCNDRSAIVWFIGSFMDPRSSRHQFLHLYGDGGDGKSAFCNALAHILSGSVATLTSQDLFSNHFGEDLEGAALVLFQDTNNTDFFSSGGFKTLTGDSSMSINPKFKKRRLIKIGFKVIVCSNYQVRIPDKNADKRRLISVTVTPPSAEELKANPNFENALKEEAETFVNYCYSQYAAKLKTNPEIANQIPCSMKNIEAAIARKYEDLEDKFAQKFTLDSTSSIKRGVMNEMMLGYNSAQNPVKVRELKDYLSSVGLTLIQIKGIYFYKGVKPIGFCPKLDCLEIGDSVLSLAESK